MNLEERINLQGRVYKLEGLLAYAEQTHDEPEITRLRAQALAGGFAVLRYATNPRFARPYGCMSLRQRSNNAATAAVAANLIFIRT